MALGSDWVHFALFTQRKHAAALSDEAPAKCFTNVQIQPVAFY